MWWAVILQEVVSQELGIGAIKELGTVGSDSAQSCMSGTHNQQD